MKVVLSPERGSSEDDRIVAWSTFEMAPTPRYRAGIAFTEALPQLADAPRNL